MKSSLLLPPTNNFADLRETADELAKSTEDQTVKRLAIVVGTLLYRCDLLEREVERIGRGLPKVPAASSVKATPGKRASR